MLPANHPLRLWLAPCFLVFSLSFAELVRTRFRRSQATLVAGIAYEVLTALFVACLVNGRPWSEEPSLLGVSPIAIWLLVYAALVPLPPRATAPVSPAVTPAAARHPAGGLPRRAHGPTRPVAHGVRR